MASINREPNGRRTIQFVSGDGKRKSIRLGKMNQKAAEVIKAKVELLNVAVIGGFAWDTDTAAWVGKIGNELAAVGLVPVRQGEGRESKLAAFLDGYIQGRTDIRKSTRLNLEVCRARLVEFFGKDKNLRDITAGDADAFLVSLKGKYAEATIGRTIRRAQQFFRNARRKKIVAENPFQDVKAPAQTNVARKAFVARQTVSAVLEACPDAEWRLIVAFSRYRALRCPSEHLVLQWGDVDWKRDRFRVDSPKTGERWVPIFPELRPFLQDVFEQAAEGSTFVISRYRDATQNLRTQFLRIIGKAGVKAWPKLFHNLRASRETELTESFPVHVVCTWLGHAALVAQKHYLQTTEEHFQRAAQGGAESGAVAVQNPVQ